MTEALLWEIFSTLGPVESCKLIKDKTVLQGGTNANYGFVDYHDHQTAQLALSSLNGKMVYGTEVKVNWAFAGGHKEDTSSHYHIFVGDLSPELDDKALHAAFSPFGSISDARVMWDQNTGRSRGYGFVAFRQKEDAERSITEMNGEWLGSRAIRCNWANQKLGGTQTSVYEPPPPDTPASATNTTVYIGNLTPDVNEVMLRAIFGEFGGIEEIRMQKDKGYAFVRYTTHENARNAITSLHGKVVGTRAIKCSWGKEKAATAPQLPLPSLVPAAAYAPPNYYQNPYAAPFPPQPYGYGYNAYQPNYYPYNQSSYGNGYTQG